MADDSPKSYQISSGSSPSGAIQSYFFLCCSVVKSVMMYQQKSIVVVIVLNLQQVVLCFEQ